MLMGQVERPLGEDRVRPQGTTCSYVEEQTGNGITGFPYLGRHLHDSRGLVILDSHPLQPRVIPGPIRQIGGSVTSSDNDSPIRVVIACRDANFGAALAARSETIRVISIVDSLHRLANAATTGDLDAIVAVDPDAFPPGKVMEVANDIPVLMFGPAEDAAAMIESVEAGALGYADIDAPLNYLIEAMHSVADGAGVVPPLLLGPLLRHVVERRRSQRRALERLQVLSPRERQVFDLTTQGLDKASVAAELFISPATARTHIQNVFRKLGVHSLAEIVALAAACGLEVGSVHQRRSQ